MTPRVLAGYCGRGLAIGIVVTVIGAASPARSARGEEAPQGHVFTVHNESGIARTINVTGGSVMAVDNPFFLDLGVNGRRCITCHEPQSNMTVTPARLQARFDATEGTDPIFRPNDGSNSPLADTSTVEARRAAYSMVLTKDLIRIGLPIPVTAEFELVSVRDPYEYAGHNANGDELSLFRRPPPATNLAFLSTVMWDGRETIEKGSPSAIHFDLAHQSNTATQGHAERPAPIDEATRDLIVAYELGLYTAQVFDHAAGGLFAAGAQGGSEALSDRIFVFGVNDPLGCDPTGATCTGSNPDFTSIVFTEYAAWSQLRGGERNGARAAVARGQDLFNTLGIPITAVAGINDDFGGRGTSRGRSSAPAPRVTTRLTPAITPCPRPSTSASPTRPFPSPGVVMACATGSVSPSATCRSTRSATRRAASSRSSPIPGAPSSRAAGRMSAASRGRSCAAWPDADRTSTMGRPRRSSMSSISTTCDSTWDSASSRRPSSWRS
jgi:hypothetical protein